MNVSLAQDLSVYQLLASSDAHQALTLTPTTLLAMLRSQVDLLTEKQIPATLWVKFPTGSIWYAELQRYQQHAIATSKIYTCHLGEAENFSDAGKLVSTSPYIPVNFPVFGKLQREYFWMVLSPQFCSLIVVSRPSRGIKKQKSKTSTRQKSLLLVKSSLDAKTVREIAEQIQQVAIFVSSKTGVGKLETNSDVSDVSEPSLISQLLLKQTQHQERIHNNKIQTKLSKLKKHNQSLQNRLQEKDTYLRYVCQELRTPLTHMKTALSLLNSPALKPPQRQRYLQMLNTQCDRQNYLITGVLELVELERSLKSPTFEAIRLSDIVPGVVSTYQPLAQEKGIMLAYTVPTELPAVWFVNGGLKQIVINLLANSIAFTPTGGQVWVKARQQGEYVHLEIRDTGIGIAESEIPKIFDRFYSNRPPTTEERGGAGLGLNIVQQYLLRCGGSISVKSKQMEGSTFTVQLMTA